MDSLGKARVNPLVFLQPLVHICLLMRRIIINYSMQRLIRRRLLINGLDKR